MKKDRREVRNLIFLLSSASFLAFFVVVGLIYYFGTTDTYLVRHILISPDTLAKASFTDYLPATASKSLVFKKIEFMHGNNRDKGSGCFEVDLHAYNDFYKLISSERSIPILTDEMVTQFNLSPPSSLTIFLQPRDNEPFFREEKIFQQIQFEAGGELFRVQFLPAQTSEISFEEWIYFRYPGIYYEFQQLFSHT